MKHWDKQEEAILEFFQITGLGWTPEQVHQSVFGKCIPLTSVRRGVSNLTAEGWLEKTDETREGYYGHDVHVWRLAGKPAQMQMELV